MKEIHINWTGPFSRDEIMKMDSKEADFGIYQFYGMHPVYGSDTLLYIGRAMDINFSDRMQANDHAARFDKYSTSDDMIVCAGHLRGRKTPNDEDWSKEIELAEKLLIYAHSPAQNSQGLNIKIKEGCKDYELFTIHVFNWGHHKRLLPEVSGKRYALGYPKDEDYKPYSRSDR